MSLPRVAVPLFGAAVIAASVPTVKAFEGWENDPYRDIAGILTVCAGHTGNVQMRRYSDAECDALLQADLVKHAGQIARCLPPPLPEAVQVAFLSLAYNIGSNAFCGSTAARKARAGDLAGACAAIDYWNKARVLGVLRTVKGLVKRRAEERKLCELGLLRP